MQDKAKPVMKVHRGVWLGVTAAFGLLTAAAVWRHGYAGIFLWQLQNLAGLQVLADLAVALSLVMAWLWRDARALGRNPWPWLLLTLLAGSFGPLGYLLSRRDSAPA